MSVEASAGSMKAMVSLMQCVGASCIQREEWRVCVGMAGVAASTRPACREKVARVQMTRDGSEGRGRGRTRASTKREPARVWGTRTLGNTCTRSRVTPGAFGPLWPVERQTDQVVKVDGVVVRRDARGCDLTLAPHLRLRVSRWREGDVMA